MAAHAASQRSVSSSVKLTPLPGGSAISPGSKRYDALCDRWQRIQPSIETASPGLQRASRQYASSIAVVSWEAPTLSNSRSLPALRTPASPTPSPMPRGGAKLQKSTAAIVSPLGFYSPLLD
eukprot:686678-Pleurochrysis_carterae.AAC.2